MTPFQLFSGRENRERAWEKNDRSFTSRNCFTNPFTFKTHPSRKPDAFIISKISSLVKGRFSKENILCKSTLTNLLRFFFSREMERCLNAKNMPEKLSRPRTKIFSQQGTDARKRKILE
jgi:hypothetical protein